jgi:glycosyltransferase involved in cell wall biosynthesis
MNRISIVLCTYNGAKFLDAQLESFLNQTRQPDEIVINDDCSRDKSAKIIENFAKRAPFPVYLEINKNNLGSTKNFERAIERSKGDIIFLSDQDDVWLEEKISRMEKEFLSDQETGLVFSNAELVDEELNSLEKKLWDFTFPEEKQATANNGEMLDVLLDQNVVTGATAAFRVEMREKFIPIPNNIPNLIHDGWIALVSAACTKIKFINEPLIKYRQHSTQQLGINYQINRNKDYAEREKSFADSIQFFQKEVARLSTMERVFNEHPIFQNFGKNVSISKIREEKQRIIDHYEARKNLPLKRLNRLKPILGELQTRNYHRFSSGYLSAAKDLFEKW